MIDKDFERKHTKTGNVYVRLPIAVEELPPTTLAGRLGRPSNAQLKQTFGVSYGRPHSPQPLSSLSLLVRLTPSAAGANAGARPPGVRGK